MLKFPKRNTGKREQNHQKPKVKWDSKKRKRAANDWKTDPKKKKQKTRSYKQQIRDLERAVNGKRPLPDHVREKKMQQLKLLKQNRNSHNAEARTNHRTLRHNNQYGVPKFFDKRKMMRKLDQNTRALAKCEDENETAELNAKRKDIMDDLYYIAHFPQHMKYISIIMARKKDDKKQLERIVQIKKHIRGGGSDDSDSEEEVDPDFQEKIREAALKKMQEAQKKEDDEKMTMEKDLEKQMKSDDEEFKDDLLEMASDEEDPLLAFASESDKEEKPSEAPDQDDAVASFLADDSDSDSEEKVAAPLSRKERRKLAIAQARQKKLKN